MKILGVDPGLRITGYGVISISKSFHRDRRMHLLEAGIIRSTPSMGIAARLKKIHDALAEVISEFRPDVLVIEKMFTHTRHPTTAILMGHVRGVVCLLSGTARVPLVSVASTHVKKAVTGRGHASKWQIQRTIQTALGLKEVPEPPDVADALAIAVSYAWTLKKR